METIAEATMPAVGSVLPLRTRFPLAACPFCSGHAELRLDLRFVQYRYVVICEICGATAESDDTIGKATRNWNRRTK